MTAATARPIPFWRMAFVAAVLVTINIGPVYRQVLHGEDRRLRGWNLFAGAAREVCAARYFHGAQAGIERRGMPIDRYAALGYRDPLKAPRKFRVLSTARDVETTGRRLCGRLGRGADVRARYRCARGGSWTGRETVTANLCAGGRP